MLLHLWQGGCLWQRAVCRQCRDEGSRLSIKNKHSHSFPETQPSERAAYNQAAAASQNSPWVISWAVLNAHASSFYWMFCFLFFHKKGKKHKIKYKRESKTAEKLWFGYHYTHTQAWQSVHPLIWKHHQLCVSGNACALNWSRMSQCSLTAGTETFPEYQGRLTPL